MRIVAIADTHFPFSPDKIPEGDVLVHAGDLMYTGDINEWYPLLDCLGNLQSKFEHIIYVPGNHDIHVELFTSMARIELNKRGVQMLGADHNMTLELPNGMTMLGLPFVQGLYGWAFNRTNRFLFDLVEQLPPVDIVVSHSPPRYQALDNGFGVEAWRLYHQRHRPAIWINGHVHECYGILEYEGTTFYNASMCDIDYNQTNAPLIIDVW